MRTRKGRIEALAEEGDAGAEQALEQLETIDESLSACQVGITMASIGIGFLGEPAIAQPDRAGARRHRLADAVIDGDRLRDRLHARHLAAHHPRRAGAEDARDHPRRARAAPLSRPLHWFDALSAPFTLGAQSSLERDRPPVRRRPEDLDEKHTPPTDLKEIIQTSAKGGDLDAERGRDARRRLPPPRAGGARGDDADPGGGHRQRRRDGRGRAAALRLLRPHPPRRDRGRQPRPGPRDRPQQLPRPALS